jgi:hypothetical protein
MKAVIASAKNIKMFIKSITLFKLFAIVFVAISFASGSLAADKWLKINNPQATKQMVPDMGSVIAIGGAKLPWGNQFIVSGSQAQVRRDNRCAFGFAYDVANPGDQVLRIHKATVSSNGQPLHIGQSFVLRTGDKKTVNGNLYLTNGIHNLLFRIETANGTAEKTAGVSVSGC